MPEVDRAADFPMRTLGDDLRTIIALLRVICILLVGVLAALALIAVAVTPQH